MLDPDAAQQRMPDFMQDKMVFADVSIAPKAMWSVDEPDIMDPQAAVEYIEDMYEYQRSVEVINCSLSRVPTLPRRLPCEARANFCDLPVLSAPPYGVIGLHEQPVRHQRAHARHPHRLAR